MGSMRQMPGWNYTSFFILKEALAHLYYIVDAYEESLKQYDELEAIFHESLITNSLSWFKDVGVNKPGADCVDLLRIPSDTYRALIIENKISVFDYRVYLFGCQAMLLIKSGNIKEFMDRVKTYIRSFIQTLKDIDLEFLGSIYGILPKSYRSVSMLPNGIALHVPKVPEARESSSDNTSSPDTIEGPLITNITNLVLTEALKSESRFDQIFSNISEQAIEYYEESGRQRFANLLKRDIAQLHLCRERYQKARVYYEQLIPSNLEGSSWLPLHTQLLIDLATCQYNLDLWPAYINSIQALLLPKCKLPAKELNWFSSELVTTSRQNLTIDYEIEMTPFFTIDNITVNDSDNKLYISVNSVNKKVFEIDKILVTLASTNSSVSILFSSELIKDFKGILSNGAGNFVVDSDSVSAPGLYQVSKVEISIGKALFYTDFNSSVKKIMVRLRRNPHLPCVSISSSKNSYVNGDTCLQISIDSKHHSFSEGKLSIFDEDGRSLVNEKTKISKVTLPGGFSETGEALIQGCCIYVPFLDVRSVMTIDLDGVDCSPCYDPIILETCFEYSFGKEEITKEGLTLNRILTNYLFKLR
ncbi:Trafficking protein particle complex subunit 10 [Smittium culicis]|uniref:Trafficking protein particle complex subunit 10 n=1 Tax=Smittium culicis TaxID=133412 RepID=A0A1R1XWJ4_9FUNG|nr:Trafficking protein particle complex subunit 10 [Smittium culicis]